MHAALAGKPDTEEGTLLLARNVEPARGPDGQSDTALRFNGRDSRLVYDALRSPLRTYSLACNNRPFMNAAQWQTMVRWLPEELWRQVDPKVAIQNDVNEMPRAGALALLDLGGRYLLTGSNKDSGGVPFPPPSPRAGRHPGQAGRGTRAALAGEARRCPCNPRGERGIAGDAAHVRLHAGLAASSTPGGHSRRGDLETPASRPAHAAGQPAVLGCPRDLLRRVPTARRRCVAAFEQRGLPLHALCRPTVRDVP